MSSPTKIFLESTALFQLGPRLDNADLAQLLAMRDSTPFDVLIAEVSWMEYLRHRKAEVRRCLDKLRPIANELNNHGVELSELSQAEQALQTYLERIDAHYGQKAEAAGFHIVPLVNDIDVSLLLKMSIDCVPPFEESREKGFRDSLIMFTILDNIRGRASENTVLVSNDNLLSEGISLHADKFETSIRVLPDLATAVQFVETGMDEQKRSLIRVSSEEAKRVLEGFRDQLGARVKEIRELTDADLGQGGPFLDSDKNAPNAALYGILWNRPADYVEIVRLVAVSFDNIVTAVWKNKRDTSASILFMIRCTAQVVARAPYRVTDFGETKKYVVGSVYNPLISSYTLTTDVGPTEEKQMEVHFYGEAELRRIQRQQWELVSLRLDKSLTSEEEYASLSEAELASRS